MKDDSKLSNLRNQKCRIIDGNGNLKDGVIQVEEGYTGYCLQRIPATVQNGVPHLLTAAAAQLRLERVQGSRRRPPGVGAAHAHGYPVCWAFPGTLGGGRKAGTEEGAQPVLPGRAGCGEDFQRLPGQAFQSGSSGMERSVKSVDVGRQSFTEFPAPLDSCTHLLPHSEASLEGFQEEEEGGAECGGEDSHRLVQRPSSLISSFASIASLPPCPQSMVLSSYCTSHSAGHRGHLDNAWTVTGPDSTQPGRQQGALRPGPERGLHVALRAPPSPPPSSERSDLPPSPSLALGHGIQMNSRLQVASIIKESIPLFTYSLIKLAFLSSETRCKFFSLTKTPEDYTIIVDEEGFLELPSSEHLAGPQCGVQGGNFSSFQPISMSKIVKSVITPLADQNISVSTLSTYQMDFILVHDETLAAENLGITHCFMKPKAVQRPVIHPLSTPSNRFCVTSLDSDIPPTVATLLMDVTFYSSGLKDPLVSSGDNCGHIHFFSFSLIKGYISLMVRIGGQALGFDKCFEVAWIAEPLAAADIQTFYISTFKFLHTLVPEENISTLKKMMSGAQGVVSPATFSSGLTQGLGRDLCFEGLTTLNPVVRAKA
ncbi:hypothetical protein M91_06276 [Bos mutus]|uniref:GATS-like protein 2 n=1 Tax=Bos mutus TaxID=72004 RepID=L8IBX1_9CETA|nr:hypothetical protein M91_06276 [Bos mutus]